MTPLNMSTFLMRTLLDAPVTCSHRDVYKQPLKSGHLSNEDSAYCPSYVEMYSKLRLK